MFSSIFFILAFTVIPIQSDSRNLKTFSECGSSLKLIDCDLDNPAVFSRRYLNQIKALYIQGPNCNLKSMHFHWDILLENGTTTEFNYYKFGDTFHLEPYMVNAGTHNFMVFVFEMYNEGWSSMSDACTFIIIPENPIPIIQGGSEITVETGKSFTLDGRDSVDMEVPSNSKGHLEYRWKCELKDPNNNPYNFCETNTNNDDFFTVPSKYVKNDMVYTFILNVKSRESDWFPTTQIVNVKTNVSFLKIKCLKNCPPLVLISNIKSPTVLQVNCVKNCHNVKKDSYIWSIDEEGFDYEKYTKFGRNSEIFYIEENILSLGTTYKITVTLKGNLVGGTSVEIETHNPPKIEFCLIFPESGESLKTQFSVACEHPEGQYMFEIYSKIDDTLTLLERNARLQSIIFILPAKSKVKVKMIDEYEYTDFQILDVTIENSLNLNVSKDELIKEIESTYFEEDADYSVSAMMSEQKYDQVVQILNVLSQELATISENDTRVEYNNKILDILSQIPLDSKERLQQVASLTNELAKQTMENQNPDIALKSTEICKNLAKKNLELISKERFKESFSEEITEHTSLLSNCSQVGLIKNLKLLEYPEIVPPTPFPLLDIPVIEENYPDYVDDDIISKLDSCTKNMVEICLLNGKTMLEYLLTCESGKYVQTEIFNATATKKLGKDIPWIKIFSQNITLRPSKDFLHQAEREISVLLCTSMKNPYWWSNPNISVPIAILQFQIEGKLIEKFSEPFSISFEHAVEKSTMLHSGLTPRKPNNTNNQNEYNFENMNMYRIDVYNNENYFIEFIDLGASILNIYVTTFFKPSPEEFRKNSVRICANKNKLFIDSNTNYDHWDYLAILPSNEMGDTEVPFSFKVYTIECNAWNAEKGEWEFSCKSSNLSTQKTVECLCYKSSVIYGMVKDNDLMEERTLYVAHELEIQACYVIFLTVFVAWILYCLLLAYFSANSKNRKHQEIFFLCDVPSFYRYGYIIIVKTGNKSMASTTSNIIIKLYGKNSESKEHVLNYPDPDKKFLQKNQEDWFFLATEYYLGDIEKIELWFDSLGYRPSWYCLEIEVVDLQTKEYWYFLVDFRFEIKNYENHFYTTKPVDKKTEKKSKMVLRKFASALHGCHMWNICKEEPSLSKVTRITIMLSIFVTNFITTLLLYDIPLLNPSDSIGEYYEYGFHKKVIWTAAVGTVVTFILHYPIIYIIRRSNELEDKENKTKKNRNLKICWLILIFLIISSMTIAIIFGFWVPYFTSLIWLTSAITSLIIYIFLLENLVLVIRNVSLTTRNRIDQIFEKTGSVIEYIESQRDVFYEKFGKYGMRPYFEPLYSHLDVEKIKEIKYWANMKEKVFEIFEEIIMITLYVILLYTIILHDKDPMFTISNKEIKDLIQGVHSKTFSDYMLGRKEVEAYIPTTLIFSLQSPQWYGKFLTKDPGMTIDNSNKYIGIARLRQHRSKNNTCKVIPIMSFAQNTCISQFSEHPDYKHYSEGWKNDSESHHFARMDLIWKYQEIFQTGTIGHVGKFGVYPGGGYVATLGRTFKNSLINENYLDSHSWLDKFTRCLFIEFLTYSANTNIFNSVTVTFEISLTGYILTKYDVYTSRLIFVKENFTFLWILFASFVLIIILLIIKLTRKVVKRKKMIFKDIWHIVDIVIIMMSVACLVYYVKRSHLVADFLGKIEKAKHNEFVSYFHLFYAETVLTSLAAILVFLATLRLWKLLRFFVIIRIVEKSLYFSAIPLLCLFICHIHLIIVFTITGILLFGGESYEFKDFSDSFMSLILSSLGFFSFDFEIFRSSLHYLYFIAWMFLNLLVVTLYVTIISIYYSQAQNFYSNYEEYNVFDFIKENFEYYKEVFKVKFRKERLKGGEDKIAEEQIFVFPKSDEHRYAKCLSVQKHKIDEMKQITLNVLRNKTKSENDVMEENDVELIKETLVSLFKVTKNEENDLFFLSSLQGNKTRLIDDMKFLEMEATLKAIYINKDKRKRDLYKNVIDDNNKQIDRILENLNVVKIGLNSVNFDQK